MKNIQNAYFEERHIFLLNLYLQQHLDVDHYGIDIMHDKMN